MGDSLSPHGRPENQTQLPAGTAVEAQWCCRMFGAELGPMPIEALRWMVESDQLDAQDLVRCGTGDSWQAVEEVAELRMLLKDKSSLENSSATTDPRPNPVLSPDEWYYQIDGTEHGPFSLADLQNLVGSSGDTAREVAVRRGLDGAWISFFSLTGNSCFERESIRNSNDGEANARPGGSRGSSKRYRGPKHSIRQIARSNADIAVAVIAWMFINAVISIVGTQSHVHERKVFATLRSLEAEAKALQSHGASQKDWDALRDRAKQALTPIVKDLQRTASASDPIRQHLLWAARDQLPKLIGPRTANMKVPRQLYERHMTIIEQELAKDGSLPENARIEME